MFIQTQDTPNPQTLKFIPNTQVLQSGTATFEQDDLLPSPSLPDALFKIDGVHSVFLAKDFVSITKNENLQWENLKPLILSSMIDYMVSGMPILPSDSANQDNAPTNVPKDSIDAEIIDLIETRVRPAVAQDGGDIVFKEFKNGIVYLELQGACSGCPSSTVTLKDGIENMLKHYIPEVQSVESI